MSAAASPVSPVPVPAELAQVPAGALLAGVLEDIDVVQVSGHDSVEVMLAEYRLWCRQTARFYRSVLETGLRRPFSIDTVERVTTPGEFAAEEARAALVWSRRRAEDTVGFAFDIFYRLHVLGEAMLAGELDEPRARAFITWTGGLSSEHAQAVCQHVLPDAAGLTVGALIERIKRACLAIDPDWAEKKYREAVKSRRVRGFLGPDGTGTLTGQSQPAERVVAACERIDALARACKRAGDRRKIDLIRSDLFLGMTDGTLEALTESEIIKYVLAHPYVVPGEEDDRDTSDGPGGGSSTDGGGGNGPGPGGPGPSSPGSGSDGRDGSGASMAPEPAEPAAEPAKAATPTEAPEPAEPAGHAEPEAPAEPGELAARVPELRVQLAALLGLNGEPAEVPGWGYVPAWLARHLVALMYGAEWRYAVCNNDGHVVDGGLITTRPRLPDGARVRQDARSGGIVEIALRADDPARLMAILAGKEATASWVPVLAELAQVVQEPGSARQTDNPYAERRTAGAALRRWIQQRDRRCVHPCCRVPASRADQDHRIGYAHGGPTTEANLSTPCRHDHRLKDEGHWRLTAPQPGLVVWTSPLGRAYESRPPPAIPPPVQAQTYGPAGVPTGGPTSPPDSCGSMLTPCSHNEHGTVAEEAAAEASILDDGKPPF